MKYACPCCGARAFEPLIEFGEVPASGAFRGSPDEPLPAVRLGFELCGSCGLVRQEAIAELRDYGDVDRGTAGQFPVYGDRLLARLKSLGVRSDGLILEIGCNDGTFLQRLEQAGFRRPLGIEPSTRLAETARAKGFEVIDTYFDSEAASRIRSGQGQASAAICRHVLEHVPEPLSFLAALRDCLNPHNGVALIEVPDSTTIPERMNVQELWDEHLCYFCKPNLMLLLRRAGLKVLEVELQPHLDTRNLLAWCARRKQPQTDLDEPGTAADVARWRAFPRNWETYRDRLIKAVCASPRPLYAIGASHPQCNFINYLGIGGAVGYMIDDDPDKIGRFPAVTGSPARIISTSEFEASERKGTVLMTAFGYPRWTERICQHANTYRMQLLDPRNLGPQPVAA